MLTYNTELVIYITSVLAAAAAVDQDDEDILFPWIPMPCNYSFPPFIHLLLLVLTGATPV